MEPWQGGWAPWCVGSVYPAQQLLTGASALPLGPLLFDRVGEPQQLACGECPRQLLHEYFPNASQQAEEFSRMSAEAFVPDSLLVDYLEEDNAFRRAMLSKTSHVLGNRLQGLKCNDGEMLLFCPTGQNMDKIGSIVCPTGTHGGWCWYGDAMNMADPSLSWAPPQMVWSKSPSLRHPIFQISAVRKDPWDSDSDSLVAARTAYSVHFFTAQREDMQIHFNSPVVASFDKPLSHVAWNPHMPGEAAVVLETGEARLFDIQVGGPQSPTTSVNLCAKFTHNIPRQKAVSPSQSKQHTGSQECTLPLSVKSEATQNVVCQPDMPAFEWWRCEYAWHPKTLLVAGSKEVSLVDFRHKHPGARLQLGSAIKANEEFAQGCNVSIVAKVPGSGNSASYFGNARAEDDFVSFTRADYDGMYQFATATKQKLILYDTRRPQTPLLQWKHGMASEPPSLLLMCPLSELRPVDHQPSAWASTTGKVILAASFQSGHLRAFCYGPHPPASLSIPGNYGNPSQAFDLEERLYAWQLPSKVFAPMTIPNNWTDVLNSSMGFFQEKEGRGEAGTGLSKSRAEEHSVGLVVIPNKVEVTKDRNSGRTTQEDDPRGFTLFQLSGTGKVIAQQFQASEQLRNVRPRVSSLSITISEANKSGRKNRRRNRYQTTFEKLPSFLKFVDIRAGSVWPGSGDSLNREAERNQMPFNQEDDAPTSGGQENELPMASSLEKELARDGHDWKTLNLFGNERGKAGGDNVPHDFSQESKDDHNMDHLAELVREVIQHSKVPLSVYEITHKVLQRGLPANLAHLVAGMPSDVLDPRHKRHLFPSFLSTLLADCVSNNAATRSQSLAGVKEEFPLEDCLAPIDSGGHNLESTTVPLPFLLESDQLKTTGYMSHGNGASDRQGEVHRQCTVEESKRSRGTHSEHLRGTKHEVYLGKGHQLLLEACRDVGRIVERLVKEEQEQAAGPVISLADSVESWPNTVFGKEGCPKFHIVRYHIPSRDFPCKDFPRKQFLGPNITKVGPSSLCPDMTGRAVDSEHQSGLDTSTCESGRENLVKESLSLLETDAFCTFVGERMDPGTSESLVFDSQDNFAKSDLCPVHLPFHAAGEVFQPGETVALAQLQSQFKQWQHSFLPHRTYRENLT